MDGAVPMRPSSSPPFRFTTSLVYACAPASTRLPFIRIKCSVDSKIDVFSASEDEVNNVQLKRLFNRKHTLAELNTFATSAATLRVPSLSRYTPTVPTNVHT